MEKKGIFLTHRHISWVLSLFIMSSFFVFVVGYFLGKKKAVEKFYKKVDQDSLADHIYYSVCAMYENKGGMVEQESTEDSSDTVESAENIDVESARECITQGSAQSVAVPENGTTVAKVAAVTEEILVSANSSKIASSVNSPTESVPKEIGQAALPKYYAELIGFGTLGAANRFVNKLKQQGFAVLLKKRRSRSAKGRAITWYQAITEKFDNKSDLIAFVDIIKDKEKLKGIRVVQC